jgi:hypothetical protein
VEAAHCGFFRDLFAVFSLRDASLGLLRLFVGFRARSCRRLLGHCRYALHDLAHL